jgi:hypothetical protein
VLWNSPHVQFSLSLILALVIGLAFAGCGGGGDNSNGGNNNGSNNGSNNGGNNGGNTTLATVTGQAVDYGTNKAAVGVTISIINPSGGAPFETQTASDGTFSKSGVPLNATRFVVKRPAPTAAALYTTTVRYQGKDYDEDASRAGGACTMPLPSGLVTGANPLSSPIMMYNTINTPPPPPPSGGCPP